MFRLHIDGEVFDFDDTKLMLSETIEWQKLSGKVPAEVMRGFNRGEPDCLKLVVYTAMRRAGRQVKFSELDFGMTTSSVEAVPEDEADSEGEQGSDPTPAKKPTTRSTPSKAKSTPTSSGSPAT